MDQGTNRPFLNNYKCLPLYKSLICQINFPACDLSSNNIIEDNSIPLCISKCSNFMLDCGFKYENCLLSIFQTVGIKKLPGFDTSC